jgi:hypothetical protein
MQNTDRSHHVQLEYIKTNKAKKVLVIGYNLEPKWKLKELHIAQLRQLEDEVRDPVRYPLQQVA